MGNEVPPGVSGNKGAKLLGTRKQKENKAGNTGIKAASDILEKREDQNRKSTFRVLGNKGKQKKFC